MVQKKLISLVVFLLVVVLLGGVLTPAFGKTKITYWCPWGGIWLDLQKEVIKTFNDSNDKIEVEIVEVPGNLMDQKFMTAALSGNVPDVMVHWGFGGFSFAVKGLLLPLKKYIDRDLKREEFIPATFEQFKYRGNVYLIPYGVAANALIYNKEVFKKVGLGRPPEDLDEVKAYSLKILEKDKAGKLTRIGYLPLDIWGGFINFSYPFGASFYNEATKKVTADHPKAVEALKWMVDYYKEVGGAEAILAFTQGFGAATQDPFMSGQLAMKFSHNWYMTQIYKFAPKLEYGVAPLPIPGKPAPNKWAMLGLDSICIPKGTKHPEEAWEFTKWMITKGTEKWASIQVINSQWIPSKIEWGDYVPKEAFEIYLDSIKKARIAPRIPVYGLLDQRVAANVDLAIRGKVDPVEALKKINEEVQPELDKAWK
jgi:multiple sugar transport system substrate-binding protein